jgi:phospholipid/cholesterol/gamma-HCH transport system ATP-binding protein
VSTAILTLQAARGDAARLPAGALDLALAAGDFLVVETPGPRRGAAFADLCMGLTSMLSGRVTFLGRDWVDMPPDLANALRGRIGRLFARPLRADTADVAARVLLGRLHHSRLPQAALLAQAADLALQFGLPGLPSGPARMVSGPDLLRAACVRAFLGRPSLVIVELPLATQSDDLLPCLFEAGAAARCDGAGVIWLAESGPALRDRSLRPTQRLRLTDAGLVPARRPTVTVVA